MKLCPAFLLALLACACFSANAQDKASESARGARKDDLGGWGSSVNEAGDCEFHFAGPVLTISVPGTQVHDHHEAPRTATLIQRDFKLTARVGGNFDIGTEPIVAGYPPYNGAGLFMAVDRENTVTVVHGVFQRPGEALLSYVLVEFCVDGKPQSVGSLTDHPVPQNGDLFLSFERRGNQMRAGVGVGSDSVKMFDWQPLPAGWSRKMEAGVFAVNTSKKKFSPQFSRLEIIEH